MYCIDRQEAGAIPATPYLEGRFPTTLSNEVAYLLRVEEVIGGTPSVSLICHVVMHLLVFANMACCNKLTFPSTVRSGRVQFKH